MVQADKKNSLSKDANRSNNSCSSSNNDDKDYKR